MGGSIRRQTIQTLSKKEKVSNMSNILIIRDGFDWTTPSTTSEGDRFMGDGTPDGATSPRGEYGAECITHGRVSRATTCRNQIGGVYTPKGLWEKSGCKK